MNIGDIDLEIEKWKLCVDEVDTNSQLTQDNFEKLADQKVLVACSGGPDSVSLAVLCRIFGVDFGLAYIEHGLNEATQICEKLVSSLAKYCDVPFHTKSLKLGTDKNLESNLEAIARKYRYEALEEIRISEGYDVILTAHHQDDVAETFLINLVRGSGSGISSLAEERANIFRPLLHWRKNQLSSMAMAIGLETFDDEMNLDSRFVRNRVRHEVLPLLNEVADRDVVPLIARTARHAQIDNRYLEELASKLWPNGQARTRDLMALDPVMRTHALRAWIKGYPPSEAELDRILEVVSHARKSVQISGHRTIWRTGAVLYQDVTPHTS